MAYTKHQLKQYRMIEDYIRPLLEKTDDGYYRYKNGESEVQIAEEFSKTFDIPCTVSNVAYVREQMFGKLRGYRTPKMPQEYPADRLTSIELTMLSINEKVNYILNILNKLES